jgi:MFS family permease
MASRSRPGLRRLAAAGAAAGASSVAAAGAPDLRSVTPALVALGLSSIAFMVIGNTTLQLTAAPAMRGRVMSLYTIVFLGSTPIGAPLAGWIGQHLGPRIALGAGGVVALVASAAALWFARRADPAGTQAASDVVDDASASAGVPDAGRASARSDERDELVRA